MAGVVLLDSSDSQCIMCRVSLAKIWFVLTEFGLQSVATCTELVFVSFGLRG